MVRNLKQEVKTVAIVGAGRLGTSLALALKEAGFSLRALSAEHPESAEESARLLGLDSIVFPPAKAINRAGIIFLCLPERKLPSLVKDLAQAKINWKNKVVYHTSGLLSSNSLRPLRQSGARIASFHPIQSFAVKNTPPARWRKIFISLEGDRPAVELAKIIIRKLGAKPLLISQKKKPLYHAACSLASNHFVALFSLAVNLLKEAGLDEAQAIQALRPLVAGTGKNLNSASPVEALTGPISRADWLAIRRHLQALRSYPLAEKIYRQLGLEAVRLAQKKGLKPARARALKRQLQDR